MQKRDSNCSHFLRIYKVYDSNKYIKIYNIYNIIGGLVSLQLRLNMKLISDSPKLFKKLRLLFRLLYYIEIIILDRLIRCLTYWLSEQLLRAKLYSQRRDKMAIL